MRRTGLSMRSAGTGIRAVALVAIAALGACDGPNRFSGPVDIEADRPRVEITIPRADSTAVPLQDSILVEARFRDNTGVEMVEFLGETLRGDPDLGTGVIFPRFQTRAVELPSPRDTVIARFLIPVEDTLKEFTNIIARAVDRDGNVGADTLLVQLGGPTVRILNLQDGQSVQQGLTLNLSALVKDPEGVTSMRFELAGSVNQTLVRNFTPPTDSFVVDTTVAVPASAVGPFTLTVRATNSLGLTGVDGPITLNAISAAGATDTIAPRLTLNINPPDRVELGSTIPLDIAGSDDVAGTGVATVGYTVLAISETRNDTVVSSDTRTYAPPRGGPVSPNPPLAIPILNVDSLSLPDTLIYEVTAYMVDAAGNCGSAVDDSGTITCETLPGGQIGAMDREGFRFTIVVVAGQTVLLPQGGQILDAQVDVNRRNLFLSNVEENQVEVFRLDTEAFGTAIGVGSEPWGLAFSRDGDSLWVANSGGTNFSVVNLDTEREVENDRLLTPDAPLFDLELIEGDAGDSYKIYPLPQAAGPAFSDRPQFAAVDAFGNVIYSTKTNFISEVGTARKAYYPVGQPATEVKLFVEHADLEPVENFWAWAHVDSITGGNEGGAPAVVVWDHTPGNPANILQGFIQLNVDTPEDAFIELVGQGSDVYLVSAARWEIEEVGFQDTTYVAASADGNFVAVGEGGASPAARVLMYRAAPGQTTQLSGIIPVSDLLTNAAEEVRGLAVNHDGSLAAARGVQGAYFFDANLRDQGFTAISLPGDAQGIALHPLHANYRSNENPTGQYRPDVHLAFVSSGNRTVDIIDTQRFRRIGSVTIRDNIVGPLRAILPFASDNLGRTCATVAVQNRNGANIGNAIRLYNANDFLQPIDPAGVTEDSCVVAKLFGVSSSGGVVIIPVRKADVLREHPVRLAN